MLFAIAIALVSVLSVWNDISLDLNKSKAISNETKLRLENTRGTIPGTMDTVYLFVFFGAFISIIVAAYLIENNVLFSIFSFVLIAIFAFISAVLANAFNSFLKNTPTINTYAAANLPLTTHLLNNYPLYVVIMGFLVAIALYAKRGQEV